MKSVNGDVCEGEGWQAELMEGLEKAQTSEQGGKKEKKGETLGMRNSFPKRCTTFLKISVPNTTLVQK